MKVTNMSTRPHIIGPVIVAPGQTVELADEYHAWINDVPDLKVEKAAPSDWPVADAEQPIEESARRRR
jgi:hypothetical protein